jgi:uncharacterized RDD family membrane protein YckC
MSAFATAGPLAGLPDPELDRRFYAGVRLRRFMAWVIDVAIILCLGVPVAVVFGLLTLGFGFVLFGFIIAAVGFLYRTALLAGPASATLGMRFTGIEFRRGNGERFDGMTAFLHTAIYTVCIGSGVLQLISCLTILGTRYRQSIADIILGTTAINRPADV